MKRTNADISDPDSWLNHVYAYTFYYAFETGGIHSWCHHLPNIPEWNVSAIDPYQPRCERSGHRVFWQTLHLKGLVTLGVSVVDAVIQHHACMVEVMVLYVKNVPYNYILPEQDPNWFLHFGLVRPEFSDKIEVLARKTIFTVGHSGATVSVEPPVAIVPDTTDRLVAPFEMRVDLGNRICDFIEPDPGLGYSYPEYGRIIVVSRRIVDEAAYLGLPIIHYDYLLRWGDEPSESRVWN